MPKADNKAAVKTQIADVCNITEIAPFQLQNPNGSLPFENCWSNCFDFNMLGSGEDEQGTFRVLI